MEKEYPEFGVIILIYQILQFVQLQFMTTGSKEDKQHHSKSWLGEVNQVILVLLEMEYRVFHMVHGIFLIASKTIVARMECLIFINPLFVTVISFFISFFFKKKIIQ